MDRSELEWDYSKRDEFELRSDYVASEEQRAKPAWIDAVAAVVWKFRQPAVLACPAGRFLLANRAGRSHLLSRILELDSEGRVTVKERESAARLKSSISEAMQSGRSVFVFGDSSTPEALVLTRIDFPDGVRTVPAILISGGMPRCFDTQVLQSFADHANLTWCEQETLAQLCSGNSIPEIAANLGVKQATTRSHVKAILSKTSLGSVRKLQTLMSRLSSL